VNKLINNNFSIILAKKLLKISKVAKDTVISRTTLNNRYYRRSKFITFEVTDKLCKYLRCSVGDLFEYKD
jgi:putative transcriptional regulator